MHFENNFLILRFLKHSDYYFIKSLSNFVNKFAKYSLSKINNFCIISGRSRSIFSSFRVSRIILKELTSSTTFSSLKKT
jgi:ribosomal protein S14